MMSYRQRRAVDSVWPGETSEEWSDDFYELD